MKITITLTILLLGLTTTLQSQNIYQIFKATQGITISNASAQETAVTKRMEVKLGDELHIPAGGEVALLEKSTRQIYTYNAQKEINVKIAKILINAKKQISNTISAVNRELGSTIKERKQPGYTYAVQGATYRGESTDSTTLAVYSALCCAMAQSETAPEQRADANGLTLKMIQDGETFYFKAINKGNIPVYFNIIRLGETPHICIPTDTSNGALCHILLAQDSWSAEQIQFVYEEGNKYLLFATEKPFNSQMLQQMFNKRQPASEYTRCTVSVAPAVID